MRAEIVISGAGSACAVGTGCDALWAALAEGRDGLREVTRFSVHDFSARMAGLWPGWEGRLQRDPLAGESRLRSGFSTLELAKVAAREAWKMARAQSTGLSPRRVAVILGTCFGEEFAGFSELTEGVARSVGARGPCLTISTACSSSTAAVGLGRDLIERGFAELVLAGGADVLTREVFAGFNALGALAPGKCSPFGESIGTTLAEGAGFVVLEEAQRARDRGVEPIAAVLGYGLSADGFHETAPDPSGAGLLRALRSALEDAGVAPAEIELVSAHGTGTAANDAAERAALCAALGDFADRIPLSSSKKLIGHAQGAAGVLELIGTLQPGARRPRRILKSSAAFGGANAASVIGESERRRPQRARREVRVMGVSAIGPHGLDASQLERAISSGRRLTGSVPEFDLREVIRTAAPRGIDPSARFASAAAGLALHDAAIQVRGALRDRTGLFTGNTRMPAQSAAETQLSIERRGYTGIAAGPFARMVLNAPAGACAKLLSLRGPHLSLSTGRGSGLTAIALAAEHLAARGDADLIVAGGHDELPIGDRAGRSEGASFAVLSAQGTEGLLLAGWGIAGPDDLGEAVARALADTPEVDGVFSALPDAHARLAEGPLDPARLPLGLVDVDAIAGGMEAAASACAFALAALALRRHSARRLLIVAGGDSLCCAAVLSAAGD